MASLNDVAKDAGLNPVECNHCKKKVPTHTAWQDFITAVLKRVAAGERVRISGLGTFRAKVFKGRTLSSPVLEAGSVTFDDAIVLRFTQSAVAKKRLNTEFEPTKGEVKEPASKKSTKKSTKTTAKKSTRAGKKGKK